MNVYSNILSAHTQGLANAPENTRVMRVKAVSVDTGLQTPKKDAVLFKGNDDTEEVLDPKEILDRLTPEAAWECVESLIEAMPEVDTKGVWSFLFRLPDAAVDVLSLFLTRHDKKFDKVTAALKAVDFGQNSLLYKLYAGFNELVTDDRWIDSGDLFKTLFSGGDYMLRLFQKAEGKTAQLFYRSFNKLFEDVDIPANVGFQTLLIPPAFMSNKESMREFIHEKLVELSKDYSLPFLQALYKAILNDSNREMSFETAQPTLTSFYKQLGKPIDSKSLKIEWDKFQERCQEFLSSTQYLLFRKICEANDIDQFGTFLKELPRDRQRQTVEAFHAHVQDNGKPYYVTSATVSALDRLEKAGFDLRNGKLAPVKVQVQQATKNEPNAVAAPPSSKRLRVGNAEVRLDEHMEHLINREYTSPSFHLIENTSPDLEQDLSQLGKFYTDTYNQLNKGERNFRDKRFVEVDVTQEADLQKLENLKSSMAGRGGVVLVRLKTQEAETLTSAWNILAQQLENNTMDLGNATLIVLDSVSHLPNAGFNYARSNKRRLIARGPSIFTAI